MSLRCKDLITAHFMWTFTVSLRLPVRPVHHLWHLCSIILINDCRFWGSQCCKENQILWYFGLFGPSVKLRGGGSVSWFVIHSSLPDRLRQSAVQSPPAVLSSSVLFPPSLSLFGRTRAGWQRYHRSCLLCGTPPSQHGPTPNPAAGWKGCPPECPWSGPAPWHSGMASWRERCCRTWSSPHSSARPPQWWWRQNDAPTGSPQECRRSEPAWWSLLSPPHLKKGDSDTKNR